MSLRLPLACDVRIPVDEVYARQCDSRCQCIADQLFPLGYRLSHSSDDGSYVLFTRGDRP
jgi:hypothetical protein